MAKQTSSKSSSGTAQAAAKKKRTSEAPAPAVAETILKADGVTISKDVVIKSDPTHEQIAERAFELYQRQSGGELNDWLSAERELRS
jgi:catalase (peroxidase I)